MNAIMRNIFVTRKGLIEPINVTEGTNMIPFIFTICDFDIPTSAEAVIYCLQSGKSMPVKALCYIDKNQISFTPEKTFFQNGMNAIQIRIVNGEKTIVTFEMIVCCTKSMEFGDEAEEEQITLIEQLLTRIGELDGICKQVEEKTEELDKKYQEAIEKTEAIEKKTEEIGIYASQYATALSMNLADVPIQSNSVIIMPKGTYAVAGTSIKDVENVTFVMNGTIANLSNGYFLEAEDCKNIQIIGGRISGAEVTAIKIVNTESPSIIDTEIINTGNASQDDTAAIQILGECNNFLISKCRINGVTAGTISSDGYIHAYGILVNRLGSTNEYTKTGAIRNCIIHNISGTDSGSTKADGDGIFIQAPPYQQDGSIEWRNDIKMSVEGCIITGCKKRGVKIASVGVKVSYCTIYGDMWYAGIDAQYGHALIENCYVKNTSAYNNSVTSAVVSSEGGMTVRDCFLSAPYTESEYHPGVRFVKRIPDSVIPSSEPWDNVYVERCHFDQVSRAVFAYTSDLASPAPAKGIYIRDCRIGDLGRERAVEISPTMFSSMEAFAFTDFRFDGGKNRTELQKINPEFVYPVGIGVQPTISMELYSRHWENEPMSGYDGLPDCPQAKIVYAGPGMGDIKYKEYTGHGSTIFGIKAPDEISTTISKQLLYNSRAGDEFTDTDSGKKYICTAAGTADSIGTWVLLNPDTTAE